MRAAFVDGFPSISATSAYVQPRSMRATTASRSLGFKARQGALVAFGGFLADARPPLGAAQLVADAVHHGLAKIGLQAAVSVPRGSFRCA
jgi:hypothetical protein